MITSSDQGELFIIRNVGNYIPAYSPNLVCSEAAALDFALTCLDITDLVICGHANCGAIKACKNLEHEVFPPQLKAWINILKTQLNLEEAIPLDQIARMNVLNQVENLRKYPVVQQKLAKGTLKIHAWFFDFDQNLMYEWDEKELGFKPLIP